jgi:hypothetical protein
MPVAPYEALSTSDRWAPRRVADADATLADGWTRAGSPLASMTPPVDWDGLYPDNRSLRYHLQAWEPMALVLSAHQHTDDPRYRDFCLALALDWIAHHPEIDHDRGFAWYDMAVGLRAYRLGYLLDVVARDEQTADEVVETLVGSALMHAEALADERRFAAHSNHGLYQAAGQVALSKRFPELPGMGEAHAQGERRLAAMVRTQFAQDGVHREHSPGYHYLVLDTLERILHCGLLEDPEALAIAGRAEEALAWMVMPDRRIVPIGDTSDRTVRDEPFSTTGNQALLHVVSAGAEGRPPEHRLQAYRESGLVIMRDGWASTPEGFGARSYLAQIAGFHSRAHKHADDFSFVWFDQGRELLTDAGRYGYLGKLPADSELGRQGFTYSDPNRIYVESTVAHNTVEIDGRSHPRRDVVPYGSGLLEWGDDGELMHSVCAARFHGSVEHRRVLVLAPAAWLLVLDALDDEDATPRAYSQRFHLAPELEAEASGELVHARVAEDGTSALWIAPLLGGSRLDGPVRGRREPMLGFISRRAYEMIPAATTAFVADGAAAHRFATLLSLSDEPPAPDPASALDARGRTGTLAWRAGGARHVVRLGEDGDGRLVVSHETGP